MMSFNIHRSAGHIILAACDQELLGKTFREGKKRLDVSEEFYGGELAKITELPRLLQTATMANLTGKSVVDTAIDAGVIDPECILMVDNIPHAQMARQM